MAATSRMISVTSCNASHTNWRKVFGFLGGIRFSPNTVFRFSMSAGCPLRPGKREGGERRERGERRRERGERGEKKIRVRVRWTMNWITSQVKTNSDTLLKNNSARTKLKLAFGESHFNKQKGLLFPQESNLSNSKGQRAVTSVLCLCLFSETMNHNHDTHSANCLVISPSIPHTGQQTCVVHSWLFLIALYCLPRFRLYFALPVRHQ